MTGSREKFEIDGMKLREEFKKRNLSLSQAERECGFGQSVLSHYCTKNYISKMAREMLTLRYNIQFDIYKKVEQKEEPIAQKSFFTEEDWERFSKVIYSATYEAMKQALSGE